MEFALSFFGPKSSTLKSLSQTRSAREEACKSLNLDGTAIFNALKDVYKRQIICLADNDPYQCVIVFCYDGSVLLSNHNAYLKSFVTNTAMSFTGSRTSNGDLGTVPVSYTHLRRHLSLHLLTTHKHLFINV